MRTLRYLPHRARLCPPAARLFSLECWGGATFDVAMRFLGETLGSGWPTARSACPISAANAAARAPMASATPIIPIMWCGSYQAGGATRASICSAFSICLNWVENMRVAIDAVLRGGQARRGCDLLHRRIFSIRTAPNIDLDLLHEHGQELEKAGCHILGVKDMAGLLKPAPARVLITALKQ